MGDDRNIFRQQEAAARAVARDKSAHDRNSKKSSSNASKGERDAKKAAAAGKRGARLAKAGGAGRSRKSLRAAAARSGRGIAIKNNKNGKDFAGLASYATQEKKGARLIFSNCGDFKTAVRTMERCAKLRPDCKFPVGHITLSLPPSSGHEMTDARWQEIVKEHLAQIDLDSSFPIIATRHLDTPHDHLHVQFCRVSIDGKVHDQRNLGLRCAAAEAVIEQKFALPLTPASEFKTSKNISKAELEMSLRKSELPPRLQISAALAVAVRGRPNVRSLTERLNAAGVGLRANIASTGKMNGFSFVYAGISFSGSKISKEYGWQSLERMIDYDQARDTQYLSQLDGTTGTASADVATAIATVDGLNLAVAEVSPTGPDAGAATSEPAPAADRAIHRIEQSALEGPVAPAPADGEALDRPAPAVGRAPGRPAPVPNRVPDRRRAEPFASAVRSSVAPLIITAPDLRLKAWQRAEKLLAEFRAGLKAKTEIALLDRAAVAAGHDPADIISTHATALDKLPAEVVQDVLRNTNSQGVREYVEREFRTAKKRSNAQQSEERISDDEVPAFRPK